MSEPIDSVGQPSLLGWHAATPKRHLGLAVATPRCRGPPLDAFKGGRAPPHWFFFGFIYLFKYIKIYLSY
jgi:hypothetical protein